MPLDWQVIRQLRPGRRVAVSMPLTSRDHLVEILAEVQEMKFVYGSLCVLVRPISGDGSVWVRHDRIRVVPDDWPAPDRTTITDAANALIELLTSDLVWDRLAYRVRKAVERLSIVANQKVPNGAKHDLRSAAPPDRGGTGTGSGGADGEGEVEAKPDNPLARVLARSDRRELPPPPGGRPHEATGEEGRVLLPGVSGTEEGAVAPGDDDHSGPAPAMGDK